jgi:hypothetical protein
MSDEPRPLTTEEIEANVERLLEYMNYVVGNRNAFRDTLTDDERLLFDMPAEGEA